MDRLAPHRILLQTVANRGPLIERSRARVSSKPRGVRPGETYEMPGVAEGSWSPYLEHASRTLRKALGCPSISAGPPRAWLAINSKLVSFLG